MSGDIIDLKQYGIARWLDEVTAEAEEMKAQRGYVVLFNGEARVTLEFEITLGDVALIAIDCIHAANGEDRPPPVR